MVSIKCLFAISLLLGHLLGNLSMFNGFGGKNHRNAILLFHGENITAIDIAVPNFQ